MVSSLSPSPACQLLIIFVTISLKPKSILTDQTYPTRLRHFSHFMENDKSKVSVVAFIFFKATPTNEHITLKTNYRQGLANSCLV